MGIMLSTLNCETKQADTNAGPYLSYLVQPNLHGKRQRLPSLKVLWIRIFSYSGPTEKETVSFRRSCKLFSKALKAPCWTTFPHPKYSSLDKLVSRIMEVGKESSSNAPSVVFIANGVHSVESGKVVIGKGPYIPQSCCSMTFIGESREGTVVMGGFEIKGRYNDHVRLDTMTVTNPTGTGVSGTGGAKFHREHRWMSKWRARELRQWYVDRLHRDELWTQWNKHWWAR